MAIKTLDTGLYLLDLPCYRIPSIFGGPYNILRRQDFFLHGENFSPRGERLWRTRGEDRAPIAGATADKVPTLINQNQ